MTGLQADQRMDMIIIQGYFFPARHCWSQPVIVLLDPSVGRGADPHTARERALHDFLHCLVPVALVVLCALQPGAGRMGQI